eukprot:CAMPEP_0176207074 /NCGR_PEP_ID=MMETSP0121_2-20121125/12428_1 /TAXON_ID=160619 /ORGANISM="Kryptoperidinium foliaceum, Strain CCMP 1326" /LENGTH=36 /DNA_ID= /DNA_START= /DNA_END= /DNA_ORIENTATION=
MSKSSGFAPSALMLGGMPSFLFRSAMASNTAFTAFA